MVLYWECVLLYSRLLLSWGMGGARVSEKMTKKTFLLFLSWVFLDSAFSLVVTNLVFQNSKKTDSDGLLDFSVFLWRNKPSGLPPLPFFALFFKNQFLNVNECSFCTFSGLLISTLIFIPFSFFPGEFVFFR